MIAYLILGAFDGDSVGSFRQRKYGQITAFFSGNGNGAVLFGIQYEASVHSIQHREAAEIFIIMVEKLKIGHRMVQSAADAAQDGHIVGSGADSCLQRQIQICVVFFRRKTFDFNIFWQFALYGIEITQQTIRIYTVS